MPNIYIDIYCLLTSLVLIRSNLSKLTFEDEHNNKIAFLGISITRVGNELQTYLFRKKTFSGVYLNFNRQGSKRGPLNLVPYVCKSRVL